jgi:hypothetical protein
MIEKFIAYLLLTTIFVTPVFPQIVNEFDIWYGPNQATPTTPETGWNQSWMNNGIIYTMDDTGAIVKFGDMTNVGPSVLGNLPEYSDTTGKVFNDSGLSTSDLQTAIDDTAFNNMEEWQASTAYPQGKILGKVVGDSVFLTVRVRNVGYTSDATRIFNDLVAGKLELISPGWFGTGILEFTNAQTPGWQDANNYFVPEGIGIISKFEGPALDEYDYVSWPDTVIPVTSVGESQSIYVDNTGTVGIVTGPIDEAFLKLNIGIAVVEHETQSEVAVTWKSNNTNDQLRDFVSFTGVLTKGGQISATGGDLTLTRAAGKAHAIGIGDENGNTPNIHTYIAESPMDFYKFDQDTIIDASPVTLIDPENYDNGGTVTAVPAGEWTCQRVWSRIGTSGVGYGQRTYPDLASAQTSCPSDENADIINPVIDDYSYTARVIVQQGCLDLGTACAEVQDVSTQVGGGGGSGGGGGDVFGPASALVASPATYAAPSGKILQTVTYTIPLADGADGKALITNGAGVVSFGDYLNGMDVINFNTAAVVPTYAEGNVFWHNEGLAFTPDIDGPIMNIGSELWFKARNNTGVLIPNGSAVYITGTQGNRPTIALSIANSEETSQVVGIATHDIANNEDGYITTYGTINDLDTSAFNEGDVVYLSETVAGEWSTAIPSGWPVKIGRILYPNQNQGKLVVRFFGTGNEGGAAGDPSRESLKQNQLENWKFEEGVNLNWTYSPGTVTAETTAPLFDTTSAVFDPALEDDFIVSDTYAIPQGLKGTPCMGSVKYLGGDGNYTLQVETDEATPTILMSATMATATVTTPIGVSFTCPTAADITTTPAMGNLKIRVKQKGATDAAAITLDEMYLGEFQEDTLGVFKGTVNFYISPTGNDNGKCDSINPCFQPHHVLDLISEKGFENTVDITIHVAAGQYVFDKTLEINQNFSNVTILAPTVASPPVAADFAIVSSTWNATSQERETAALTDLAMLRSKYPAEFRFDDGSGASLSLDGISVNGGSINISNILITSTYLALNNSTSSGRGITVGYRSSGSTGFKNVGSIVTDKISVQGFKSGGFWNASGGSIINKGTATASGNGGTGFHNYAGGTIHNDWHAIASNNYSFGFINEKGGGNIYNASAATSQHNRGTGFGNYGGGSIYNGSTATSTFNRGGGFLNFGGGSIYNTSTATAEYNWLEGFSNTAGGTIYNSSTAKAEYNDGSGFLNKGGGVIHNNSVTYARNNGDSGMIITGAGSIFSNSSVHNSDNGQWGFYSTGTGVIHVTYNGTYGGNGNGLATAAGAAYIHFPDSPGVTSPAWGTSGNGASAIGNDY